MAEAVVEERPLIRFYCHMCNVEFRNAANNFTCPHCSDGFIEELQDTAEPNSAPATFDAGGELYMLHDDGDVSRQQILGFEQPSDVAPRTHIRYATNAFPNVPFENLVQDFISNLGVAVNLTSPNYVQLFLGNPGDYAWGREGLDAIVTQLLNQMDSYGPPPLSKAVIDGLEMVEVNGEQVGQNLQCSVCWEQFVLKEQVRQLPCQHIYHEQCIRPWLELHGTCPICRKNLGGEDENAPSSGADQATPSDVNMEAEDERVSLLRYINLRSRQNRLGGDSSSSTDSPSAPSDDRGDI